MQTAQGLTRSIRCFNRRQSRLGKEKTRHQSPDSWFLQCEVPVNVTLATEIVREDM